MRSANPSNLWYERAYSATKRALRHLLALGDRTITVMLVPDSDRPVRSFRMRISAAVFLSVLSALMVASVAFLATATDRSDATRVSRTDQLRDAEASLERVRGEIVEFLEVYDQFENTLVSTLSRVESGGVGEPAATTHGDLATLLRAGNSSISGSGDIELLSTTIRSLRDSLGSLDRLADVVEVHQAVVSDLPTLWPLINGLGQVTMEFGPNIHPIMNAWYMHRGFDIWHFTGTPIVASGNGVVDEAGYDALSGFGWYVEIEHPYGFRTKYTHLSRVDVAKGDVVEQGQRIGALGSSGLSTGPHLHFEIQLGTELIDPAYFLKLSKPDFNRRVIDRY